MTHADLETVYEALAQQLDRVGEENGNILLAKLALLLAHQINDVSLVLEAIDAAAQAIEA